MLAPRFLTAVSITALFVWIRTECVPLPPDIVMRSQRSAPVNLAKEDICKVNSSRFVNDEQ